MKNKEGITFRYSNKTHIKNTKRLKYQKLLKNYKNKNGIFDLENKLSEYNSKSCLIDKFKDFIKNKNELNKILLEKYQETIFRKYKWYSYINRKRAETTVIRNIKKTFKNSDTIIFGDWSDKLKKTPSTIRFISTPNISLKRKLNEYFTVYNIDEFRTSCLNYKTETKCENIYLPDKTGINRKIHSVLMYQTESNRMGCINRDKNAVNNMIKITNSYLLNKTRPEKFKRSFKFPEEIKDNNQNLKSI
jgi:hypothetical protein